MPRLTTLYIPDIIKCSWNRYYHPFIDTDPFIDFIDQGKKEGRQGRRKKEREGEGRSKEGSKGRRQGGMKNLKLCNLYNSWQLVSRLTTHFPPSPLIKLSSLPLHQNCSSQGYHGHPQGYTKESVISPHFELHHLLVTYILSSPPPTNWRRKWQPTPVFLSGESHGWRRLVGCHLRGHTESDMTEVT